MSFIPMNLDDVSEPHAQPIGSYELQIVKAENTVTGENSKHPGTPMIKFSLGFTDLDLDAPGFNHYMVFPYEGQTDYLSLTLLGIKRFLVHFGIAYSNEGLDPEAIAFESIGHSATCSVVLGTPNANGDVFNQLGYLPKLKDEGGRGTPPTKAKKRA